jgi:hypothetical protein
MIRSIYVSENVRFRTETTSDEAREARARRRAASALSGANQERRADRPHDLPRARTPPVPPAGPRHAELVPVRRAAAAPAKSQVRTDDGHALSVPAVPAMATGTPLSALVRPHTSRSGSDRPERFRTLLRSSVGSSGLQRVGVDSSIRSSARSSSKSWSKVLCAHAMPPGCRRPRLRSEPPQGLLRSRDRYRSAPPSDQRVR